jgi:hypothetical protein
MRQLYDLQPVNSSGATFARAYNTCSFIKQAFKVLGKYLMLDKNKDDFVEWLNGEVGVRKQDATACADCLRDWCYHHL